MTVCNCAPDCAERIACKRTDLGHFGCGWCAVHEQARHLCYCPHPDPEKGTEHE